MIYKTLWTALKLRRYCLLSVYIIDIYYATRTCSDTHSNDRRQRQCTSKWSRLWLSINNKPLVTSYYLQKSPNNVMECQNQTCTLLLLCSIPLGMWLSLCTYIIIQHLCDLLSPTTSLVCPEKRGTIPELGDNVRGFNWTGMSFVTSGIELKLWLLVDVRLFSTGLPLVLIWARCFFKSASVPGTRNHWLTHRCYKPAATNIALRSNWEFNGIF